MKWFNFLNKQHDPKNYGKSLSENEIIEKDNLIVCQKCKYLQFAKFRNYLDFVKYMINNSTYENRCFYEVVPGGSPQKPYFDIEFYVSSAIAFPEYVEGQLILPTAQADEAIKEMVKLIKVELPPLSSNNSHIFVFTSHKDTKRSYHIVVEGFCFSDNKSNRLFSEKIRKNMPEHWKGIIDTSMYKSTQQFRIAGSCKFGTDRFKIINNDLTLNYLGKNGWIPKVEFESQEHKLLLAIEASLITQTVGSILMPSLLDENEEKSTGIRSGEGKEYTEFFEPLTSDNIKAALTLCHRVAGLEYGDPRFPYEYMRVVEDNGESSIILLKRRFPSRCRICNRIHEHENPFMLIIGLDRDIYLDCRRNEHNKKLYIGKLGPTSKALSISLPVPKIDINASLPISNYTYSKSSKPEIKEILPPLPTLNLTDLQNSLGNLSQQVAPKIKLKEKDKIQKENILLNFSIHNEKI